MTTSSSPCHGRDPGVTLIRISPARIQTQVTQTVRYRPVRSLLLLGLLVVISLFVLFTLSQMAVVQHTMMAQLETGRPGGGGWVGVTQGGRSSRPAQKPWRSQFNQFKIEPLLIRNAPSVEVNTAMAANRRRAGQIAAIIVRNSLLITQSPFHNLSIQPTDDLLTRHSPLYDHHTTHPPSLKTHSILHSTEAASNTRQHTDSSSWSSHLHNNNQSKAVKDTTNTSSSTTTTTIVTNPLIHHSLIINQAEKTRDEGSRSTSTSPSPSSSSSAAPSSLQQHVVPHSTPNKRGHTSKAFDSSSSGLEKESSAKERRLENASDGDTGRHKNDEKRSREKSDNWKRGDRAREDNSDSVRRRFLDKLECEVPEGDCDTKILYTYHDSPLLGKPLAHGEPIQTNSRVEDDRKTHHEDGAGGESQRDSGRDELEKELNDRLPDDDTEMRQGDSNDKGSEPLATEFSESEKEFEPLYLREDEDYGAAEERTTESPTPRPSTPTRKILSEEEMRALPMCPEIPPGLLGHLDINLDCLEQLRLSEVLKQLEWVLPGGKWSPAYEPTNPCLPRHKVAVVLPYRDRLHHLIILLSWLHPILRRQQLEYTIYVAEQAGNATFNKGSIMNAGFMEAWQRSDANCFVFHDVDLLPEDDRNMYSCPPQPRHLSVGVDTLGYKLPYFLLVGGVFSVRGDHFLRLNGYSNMYWGWGGEDDDMGYRIKQSGLSITRPPNLLARYTMIRHLKRRPLTWKVRGKLVRTSGRRYRLDGLNTLKYSLLALHKHPLFTHLLLDVGTPPENLVRLDAH